MTRINRKLLYVCYRIDFLDRFWFLRLNHLFRLNPNRISEIIQCLNVVRIVKMKRINQVTEVSF